MTSTSNKIQKTTIIKKPALSNKTSFTIKPESRNITKTLITQKTYNFKKSIPKETDDKNKFQLKRIKVILILSSQYHLLRIQIIMVIGLKRC